MIHIIGDSHSGCFSGPSWVTTWWLGAATAFNLWKKNHIVQEVFSKIPKDEEIFFCFGEIDSRIHIYKSFRQSEIAPIGFFIDITAYTYVRYINTLKHNRLINIMAIPPQGIQGNFFEYEFYADRKLRQQFTDGLNFNIENLCASFNIPFVDIWENKWNLLLEHDDKAMWPEEDFKEDQCHIKNEVAIPLLEDYIGNR
jgi:hypothetical protein